MEPPNSSPPQDYYSKNNSFRRLVTHSKANLFVGMPFVVSLYLVGACIVFMVCARTILSFNIIFQASQAPLSFRVNTSYLSGQAESLALLMPEKAAHTLRDLKGVGTVKADVNVMEASVLEKDDGESRDLEEPDFMQMPVLRPSSELAANLSWVMKRMPSSQRKRWLMKNWHTFNILKVDSLSDQFEDRLRQFFCNQSQDTDSDEEVTMNKLRRLLSDASASTSDTLGKGMTDEQNICKTNGNTVENFCSQRFFLTWISPVSSFGPRERLGLESIFKFHPNACVAIISRTMDSEEGQEIIGPFLKRGYRITAVTPDIDSLFAGLPAAQWYKHLRAGTGDPGSINLMQNLSNIMRLAALYKYGGTYLDTDIIVMRPFDGLRNVLGAQSRDNVTGQWNRLNNAVLVFDREHPIVYEFLREFVTTFDGSRWGWNGPYLVSRVVEKVRDEQWQNCSSVKVLPLEAFYPVNWIDISEYFRSPANENQTIWQEKQLGMMRENSYTLHLWNKKSNHLRVEKGSIMEIVFKKACMFCKVAGL